MTGRAERLASTKVIHPARGRAGRQAKRKAAEMNCDDEETLRLVQQLMISIDCMSERDEEDAAPPPGEHHTGSWTVAMISARLKQRKVSRSKADQALARDMDARAEECVVGRRRRRIYSYSTML
jgi:hypothetical protein